ncbi:MAG: dihydrodipicolinate synthase family protein [Rhodothermales bacterium]
MRTAPVTSELLASSVLAVPPLARHADLTLNEKENRRLIRHIEQGGVRILLYGGNANFYHIDPEEYRDVLAHLAEAASEETTVIPSIGPAYGTMMMQARILRDTAYPTAMALPCTFASTSAGMADGLRRAADVAGKPLVLYIKSEGMLDVADIARLDAEGIVAAIKYAVVRENPLEDALLRSLVEAVPAARIVSGIGEQPAIAHLRRFGLVGFTSGCVCIAPALSQSMLHALKAGDYGRAEAIRRVFEPLETLRNEINPIRVLHEAVRLAGVADTGPMLPFLSPLEAGQQARIQATAQHLLTGQDVTV